MRAKVLTMAVGITLLFVLPVLAVPPVAAFPLPAHGLVAAYWKGSFFGTALPTDTSCATYTLPTNTGPPTTTTVEPDVAHGASTSYLWVETGFSVNGITFHNVQFSAEWTGNINLAGTGVYAFALTSDDGSWLYIDGALVVNNGGVHGPSTVTSAPLTLTSGLHSIEVDFYETCNTQSGIDLTWKPFFNPPGFVLVPTDVLTPACNGSNTGNSICTPPTGVPEFGFAATLVGAVGLLALVLIRRTTLERFRTTA